MKVVSIAAGCVGLASIMCTVPILAADVPSSFIQQEAARRHRWQGPLCRVQNHSMTF